MTAVLTPPKRAPAEPETDPGEESGLRSGPALIKATLPFEGEHRWTTWRLFGVAVLVYAACLAAVFAAGWWPAKILAGGIAGLVLVRLFIFYHDALHGAIFRKSRVGQACMSLIGLHVLAVRSVWKETHDYHHQHNAQLATASIGSYPILTVEQYRRATPQDRRAYRMARHPLTMGAGLLTVFALGMVFSAFRRNPRRHWAGPVGLTLQIAAFVVLGFTVGWFNATCLVVVPSVVAMAVGSYLFYAQHNFPSVKLHRRRDWNFTQAALTSSSLFDMSPMMRWFTGDIGFHHVHHLNHRIPFYRLEETMRALPELQAPGRTSWRLRDIRACLSQALWDPEEGRMRTWAEARDLLKTAPADPKAPTDSVPPPASAAPTA